MHPRFWHGKRVFVTGHTGFKGSWLCLWLNRLGAIVTGYSLQPHTTPSLFDVTGLSKIMKSNIGDVRNLSNLKKCIKEAKPDIVIHLAAQALVRPSYRNPVETYETNIMGVVNLLEAVRSCKNIQTVLVITSDKCYENNEREKGYREDEAMGGFDPYSSSKGCAELVVSAYRQSFFQSDEGPVAVATSRAGNVIGGGDWSEDRLIPDMVKSFSAGNEVIIRYPSSIRPWQHVFEALHGYLLLIEQMWQNPRQFSEGWNFGPNDSDAKSVSWIVDRFAEIWGGAIWKVENNGEQLHEAGTLRLDCTKAKTRLNWKTVLELDIALEWIANWYRCHHDGGDVVALSEAQLNKYQKMVMS